MLNLKKLNKKGFSHVEMFVVLVVIVAVASVGYFVYKHHQTAHAGSSAFYLQDTLAGVYGNGSVIRNGNFVYVDDGSGKTGTNLDIYNVANPASPVLIHTVSNFNNGYVYGPQSPSSTWPYAFDATNGVLYTVEGSSTPNTNSLVAYSFDSAGDVPLLLSTVTLPSNVGVVTGVAATANNVYLAYSPLVKGSIDANSTVILSYQVTVTGKTLALSQIGTFPSSGEYKTGVFSAGVCQNNCLVVAGSYLVEGLDRNNATTPETGDLKTFNISNPASLTYAANYQYASIDEKLTGSAVVESMSANGSTVYVGGAQDRIRSFGLSSDGKFTPTGSWLGSLTSLPTNTGLVSSEYADVQSLVYSPSSNNLYALTNVNYNYSSSSTTNTPGAAVIYDIEQPGKTVNKYTTIGQLPLQGQGTQMNVDTVGSSSPLLYVQNGGGLELYGINSGF